MLKILLPAPRDGASAGSVGPSPQGAGTTMGAKAVILFGKMPVGREAKKEPARLGEAVGLREGREKGKGQGGGGGKTRGGGRGGGREE